MPPSPASPAPQGTALTGPAPSESTTDPAVLQGLLGGPKGLQALSEELQRLGPWDPKNPHAALQQLHQRLLALTATAFPDPARGRAALGALTAAVSSALVAAAAPAFAAAAGDGGAAPEIEAAFRLATFGPQLLWLLMVALPRSPITRAVMEPWFAVAFFAIVHGYVDVVGGQQVCLRRCWLRRAVCVCARDLRGNAPGSLPHWQKRGPCPRPPPTPAPAMLHVQSFPR